MTLVKDDEKETKALILKTKTFEYQLGENLCIDVRTLLLSRKTLLH